MEVKRHPFARRGRRLNARVTSYISHRRYYRASMVKPRICSGVTSFLSCSYLPEPTENVRCTAALESPCSKRRRISSSLESEFRTTLKLSITYDPMTADPLFFFPSFPYVY